jgi:hypothetical protein
MWEPRRLPTLWASMACCTDNFTFHLYNMKTDAFLGNVGLHLQNYTMSQTESKVTNFLLSSPLSFFFLCFSCFCSALLRPLSPSRPHSILTQIHVWVTAYDRAHILHNLIDWSNMLVLRSDGMDINPVRFHNVPWIGTRLISIWRP